MRDPIIHTLLNDAIQKWIAVTGVSPGRKSLKIRLDDGAYDEWELSKLLTDLRVLQELDPTGLSTFMLLRGAAEEYLKGLSIVALDFLTDPAGVEKRVAPLRDIRALLEHEHVVQIIDDFLAMVRRASIHYRLPKKQLGVLDKLLENKLQLAYVRRDALRSIDTLEAHQFVHGKPGNVPLKYNPEIFEFWNINSLLKAMQQQSASGITLCMVRDQEEPLFSFFVIAIRNGESLTILTDRQEVPHPDHKYMTRSRAASRRFEARAERHRFPYELLDLEVTADAKVLYAKESTALVPMNTSAVKISTIAEMAPDCFVWLILLFDLVRDRYGTQNAQLPAPSYTGEMLVTPHALVGAHCALVQSGTYQPLALPALDGSMVTHKTTAGQWRMKAKKHNRWMMQRYADKVPEAALNIVGVQTVPQIAAQVRQQAGLAKLERARTSGDGSLSRVVLAESDEEAEREREVGGSRFGESGPIVPALTPMDPLAFGTKAALARDRLWVARKNQVTVVQSLALKEFDETYGVLAEWYATTIATQVERLLDAAAIGSLQLTSMREAPMDSKKVGGDAFDRPILTTTTERMKQQFGANNSVTD